MVGFGEFKALCKDTPSYTWCNLFYRQLRDGAPLLLKSPSIPSSSAPIGINPTCGIPRVGQEGSLSNIGDVVACGVSVLVVAVLILLSNRRQAAVGRFELIFFLVLYLLSLPVQILTTGSFLEQGSTALVALTAIHVGLVVALFWVLLANGIVATQVVEDGTPASLVPMSIVAFLLFGLGVYIGLDVGLGFTDVIGGLSNPPDLIRSIPLFVLTSIWPAAAALAYLITMAYIVLKILNERRPMFYYSLSASLFILGQLAWFLLGRVICKGSSSKVDGSFIATVLETAAVGVLFLAWKSITEESWEDDYYR